MVEETQAKANLVCPKCGSAALGATKSIVQTSVVRMANIRLKCLHCGTEFTAAEKNA